MEDTSSTGKSLVYLCQLLVSLHSWSTSAAVSLRSLLMRLSSTTSGMSLPRHNLVRTPTMRLNRRCKSSTILKVKVWSLPIMHEIKRKF